IFLRTFTKGRRRFGGDPTSQRLARIAATYRAQVNRRMSSDLESVSQSWFQAWLENDAATIERLAAADYVYIGPAGLVLDRIAVLNIIRSPSYRLEHGKRSEIVSRSLGHAAGIVRHRYQGAGSFEGTPFNDDHR